MTKSLALLVAAVLAAGCHSSTEPVQIAGTYTLVAIGGSHLPVPIEPGSGDAYTDGSFVAQTSGAFSVTTTITTPPGPESPPQLLVDAEAGTYTVHGSSVTLSTGVIATIDGSTLSVPHGAVVWRYVK